MMGLAWGLFLLVVAGAFWVLRSKPNAAEEEVAKNDTADMSPEERGDYYRGRTDIPVDTGGFYQGEDVINMAAMVRAAAESGGMVIGNVQDDGKLEINVIPFPSPPKDPKDAV